MRHKSFAFLRTIAAAAIAAVCLTAFAPARAATELTVYTAYENDDLARFKGAFEKDNPDVVINWVRDSTGVIASKLLAEKDNVRADAVWGLAVTSLARLEKENLLEAYAPKNLATIPAKFRDSHNPPYWVGNNAWVCAIIYNEAEGKKRNIPAPKTWTDLANPVYKGQIVMPDPASSGTGFMYVSAWIQSMGEDKAWAFMDKLNDNIAFYTHSGSSPAVMAARGERVVGLAFGLRGSRLKEEGAPIDIIMPTEGLGWDLNAIAIMKGTPKLAAAKRLVDWATSDTAMKLYGQTRTVVAVPGYAKKFPHLPGDMQDRIMKQDFAWASANLDPIVDKWEKRYGSKIEPKKK
jgi:iron(III) transport system substrate-binding protein